VVSINSLFKPLCLCFVELMDIQTWTSCRVRCKERQSCLGKYLTLNKPLTIHFTSTCYKYSQTHSVHRNNFQSQWMKIKIEFRDLSFLFNSYYMHTVLSSLYCMTWHCRVQIWNHITCTYVREKPVWICQNKPLFLVICRIINNLLHEKLSNIAMYVYLS
jgi:hypothetical protein